MRRMMELINLHPSFQESEGCYCQFHVNARASILKIAMVDCCSLMGSKANSVGSSIQSCCDETWTDLHSNGKHIHCWSQSHDNWSLDSINLLDQQTTTASASISLILRMRLPRMGLRGSSNFRDKQTLNTTTVARDLNQQ
jgi:hypothetical protein